MVISKIFMSSSSEVSGISPVAAMVRKPGALPRMDFEHGIPDDCRTMVVVPTLLTDPKRIGATMEGLELRYLANRDPNLWFALLTDFSDADQEHLESDDPYDLFDQILSNTHRTFDLGRAFYLGYEMAKAMTALTLGKTYRQDEALHWGMLTRRELTRLERRAMRLARLRDGATGVMEISHDLDAGLAGAEVVYTDCWPRRATEEERALVARRFLPYQVTAERLLQASPGVLFLPCPPVTRGEEVSTDAMEHLGSHVYAAKEYLLHAQNAVLATLLSRA